MKYKKSCTKKNKRTRRKRGGWGGGRKKKTRKMRGGDDYTGKVILVDFNKKKMKDFIEGEYPDNVQILKYFVEGEDNGILHLQDYPFKKYKDLRLPLSAVNAGLVTIEIIDDLLSGGRKKRGGMETPPTRQNTPTTPPQQPQQQQIPPFTLGPPAIPQRPDVTSFGAQVVEGSYEEAMRDNMTQAMIGSNILETLTLYLNDYNMRVQDGQFTPQGNFGELLNNDVNNFRDYVQYLQNQTGGRRKKKTRKYKGNKYPYKNITKKEAIADFIKLKTTTNPRSLNGLEIVNYGTEKLRVRTKYRGKSLIQRWKDKKARKTLKKFANRLYKGSYTDSLLHAYRSAIALSWGTLSSMRTSAALQMYKKYNAKKVLDFTAGWGSRMTAALAADIDYIGIDSNKSLKKGYNKIIKTVKKHTKSKVKLFFQPAETVNYSKLDYDFVFTSPPYEYLELYEHMKNYEGTKKIKQAHSANDKRRKNDGFYDTFLIPTIKEIYKHLPKGKWMCLNVPDLMYDKIKKKWKACNKKEDYMISKRVGSNMKSDDRRGQEFVYCWKKK